MAVVTVDAWHHFGVGGSGDAVSIVLGAYDDGNPDGMWLWVGRDRKWLPLEPNGWARHSLRFHGPGRTPF